jgi:hypothetical protein
MPGHRLMRQVAVTAIREAAGTLHVAPGELTPRAYRAFRSDTMSPERLPSELTISLLFGGWRRACDEAARPPWLINFEDDVRSRLYGHDRT